MREFASSLVLLVSLVTLTACFGESTDAATRLAFDIEAGADRLGRDPGATHSVRHHTPSKPGECSGPYAVQLDKVGALIVWCKDAAGRTVTSHSTSYHARFVDIPRTYRLEKDAGTELIVDLERRNGRAVVTDVR